MKSMHVFSKPSFLAAAYLLLFGFLTSAFADPSKIVNQRDAGSSSRKFIVFCSRDSPGSTELPGHAFVLFGDAPEDNEQGPIIITRGAGYYPADTSDAARSLLKRVPGKVINDYLAGPILPDQCRLVIKIEQATYDKELQFIDQFAASGYNLLTNNCVTMVKDLAQHLGLAVPSDSGINGLPSIFTRKLTEKNGTPVNINDSHPIVIP
jgi:hypothetical protein